MGPFCVFVLQTSQPSIFLVDGRQAGNKPLEQDQME